MRKIRKKVESAKEVMNKHGILRLSGHNTKLLSSRIYLDAMPIS